MSSNAFPKPKTKKEFGLNSVYQMILEGKMSFDEKVYDEFQIEEPDPNRVEFKEQVELLRKRLLEDLPDFEDEIEAQNPFEEKTGEKLQSGIGFFEYKAPAESSGQGIADDDGVPGGIGVTYYGEWRNLKRHGKGVLKNHRDKWEYRGSFVDNQIDGFGKYSWSSGDTYEGWFSNSRKCGFGSYMWASNGSQYTGYW